MRRVLSVLLVLLLTAIASLDPLACPDGCSEQDRHEHESAAVFDCIVCHHAMSGAVSYSLPIAIRSTVSSALSADDEPIALPPPTIDHPPRLA
jgi:hypothetical protein